MIFLIIEKRKVISLRRNQPTEPASLTFMEWGLRKRRWNRGLPVEGLRSRRGFLPPSLSIPYITRPTLPTLCLIHDLTEICTIAGITHRESFPRIPASRRIKPSLAGITLFPTIVYSLAVEMRSSRSLRSNFSGCNSAHVAVLEGPHFHLNKTTLAAHLSLRSKSPSSFQIKHFFLFH